MTQQPTGPFRLVIYSLMEVSRANIRTSFEICCTAMNTPFKETIRGALRCCITCIYKSLAAVVFSVSVVKPVCDFGKLAPTYSQPVTNYTLFLKVPCNAAKDTGTGEG